MGTTSACAENTGLLRAVGRMKRNYLRVRGEYSPSPSKTPYPGELPPRARRILFLTLANIKISGTTSACAENTCPPPGETPPSRNYLRVRGEYDQVAEALQSGQELPPRARRILAGMIGLSGTIGTTSACAENTSWPPPTHAMSRNYLRVRGEYSRRMLGGMGGGELPPRARRIP